MTTVQAVIGAGFGDEGKGLMVDYFSNQAHQTVKSNIVVRFNGGAQSSHTVVTPKGDRHIFGHFGAGIMTGSPTYLSKFFVVNPMLFRKEAEELAFKKISIGKVYVDPECIITTPYDMFLNQYLEKARGSKKHGSCGIGFNETIEKSLKSSDITLRVKDLFVPGEMERKFSNYLYDYLPNRIMDLGIQEMVAKELETLLSSNLLTNYIRDIDHMKAKIDVSDASIINKFDHVIFEGAQGLLLDQNSRYFPHVTRSNTGMKNVIEIASEVGIDKMEAVYISRCYATRHGNGTFRNEIAGIPYFAVEEKTNKSNEYQGHFRYGWPDILELADAIDYDASLANGKIALNKSLAITCFDQLDNGNVKFILVDFQEAPINDFMTQFMDLACVQNGYVSYGQTRNDVKIF